jgi:hypothetical protein
LGSTEIIVLGRIGKLRAQLFLINIKNGTYKQITNDTVSTKRDPLFLPGGKEIVLAYRPDRSLRQTVPDELWKMNLDMSNKIQLTLSQKEIQLQNGLNIMPVRRSGTTNISSSAICPGKRVKTRFSQLHLMGKRIGKSHLVKWVAAGIAGAAMANGW